VNQVPWNDQVRLIISDVDDTVAPLYERASSMLVSELSRLLSDGRVLFFISGQSVDGIEARVINQIPGNLRKRVLVGHCSGAEVWGYDPHGSRLGRPYYSLYRECISESQQQRWREVTAQLLDEFSLRAHRAMPIPQFAVTIGSHPQDIMVDDRGPQITFELVNGCDVPVEEMKQLGIQNAEGVRDLRIPISQRAEELFEENELPITPRLAGVFAIDFALRDVSKATAVKFVLQQKGLLSGLGLSPEELKNSKLIEVWGDKFSVRRGGTDRHILEPLDPQVRAITFRQEDPFELPAGRKIVIWDGEERLQDGLLEYLQSR
jgi:hypothetical protein